MATKTAPVRPAEREGKSLFSVMHIASWAALCIGIVLCLTNLSNFSDSNASLMTGIGFMVGSVFIYIIGMAMDLVHKRKSESDAE